MSTLIQPPPEPGGPPDRVRGSAKVAAGIFLSRISGFVREMVFANYFGNSMAGDAWRAATKVPNLLQNLLGEGTLSASVIPIYSELIEEDRDEDASRFAGAILGLLTVTAASVALLGVLLAPFFVGIIFSDWGAEQQALTTSLVRIVFPMTAILVVSAWSLAILNSHRRLFLSYVAPVAWNAAMIGALLLAGERWGWRDGDLAMALAWGALIGGGLQLLVQLPTVLRLLGEFRPSISLEVGGVRSSIQAFFPALAARGAVNLSGYLDLFLAGFLAVGALSALGYAQVLYLLPISLFGASVAAAELPELSRERSRWGEEGRAVLEKNLTRSLYFVLPSAVAYVAFGDAIVGALFGRGEFADADVLLVWIVLATYSIGMPASSQSRILTSVFFAQRDTRRPAAIAYARVGLSGAVALLLMFPLDRAEIGADLRLGAVGLACGATLGAWLEFFLLRRALRSREILREAPKIGWIRIALACALATGGGWAVKELLPELPSWMTMIAILGPYGVVYLGATYLLGVSAPLEDMIRRRRR